MDALRSGEYAQGKNVLHQGDKFCCLGVLCDLAVRQGVAVDVGSKLIMRYGEIVTYDDNGSLLPDPVMEWAGLGAASPYIFSAQRSLTGLNDGGRTFTEIADLIEADL